MKIKERMVSVSLSLVLLLHFLTIVSVAEVKVYRSVETEKKQTTKGRTKKQGVEDNAVNN